MTFELWLASQPYVLAIGNDNIFRKCSFCVCSCSLFRRWLQQVNVTRNCSIHVSACFSCCNARRAQSGGGDGFLFRPSMIPFLNVVRRWSPFASALGSVAVSCNVIISVILLCNIFK